MEIKLEVQKIRFRNEINGYTVADMKILDHPEDVEIPTAERIFTGIFPAIHKKDEFIAEGSWMDAGRYGYQFNVRSYQLVFPETSKGMVSFLTRSVKGVGPLVAKRIVEVFKDETFSIILKKPDRLLEVKGVNPKKKDIIHRAVSSHMLYEEVALFLLSLGFSHIESSKIYEEMGYQAISSLSSNPYSLLSLKGFSFKDADAAAEILKFPIDNPERIQRGIMHFLSHRMNTRGDMFTRRSDILLEISDYLERHGGYRENFEITQEKIIGGLESLNIQQLIKIEDDCVYISYYHHAEDSIVASLKRKISEKNEMSCSLKELENYLSDLSLADNQKKAVIMTILNKISVLSGGPGTGKTHTINAIIKAVEKFLPLAVIRLCAPTGRAAKRMTEMTGKKAETIHRMLGLKAGEDLDESEVFDNVDADFLIIDESSMIDAHIFHILLKAITSRTRILLVGDYNQLPSVGPGLILRDLMESGVVPVTILNEIFRQAKNSQIVTNSYSIIQGKGVDELTFDKTKRDFMFSETEDVEKIIETTIKVMLKALSKGASLDDIQILTVVNGGDLGVNELNRRIQRQFNPKKGFLKEIRIKADLLFREGDRVMQTRNNYDLNVYNGETGKIKSIGVSEGKIEVLIDFIDRTVIYGDEELNELVLSYAMSVHKSQGSEFKYVIMPIHHSLKVLLNRNIIYTAWTRAKEKVILIGSKKELSDGIGRIDNTVRNSLIRPKLQA